MDALTFLYWSLGIGWALLVIFLCVALVYTIRILRDLADTTSVVRDTAETMNDNVNKVTDRVVDTAEQITEYIVKPFTVAQYLAEKIKPIVEMMQQKGTEMQESMEEKMSPKDSKKTKRKSSRKKT